MRAGQADEGSQLARASVRGKKGAAALHTLRGVGSTRQEEEDDSWKETEIQFKAVAVSLLGQKGRGQLSEELRRQGDILG